MGVILLPAMPLFKPALLSRHTVERELHAHSGQLPLGWDSRPFLLTSWQPIWRRSKKLIGGHSRRAETLKADIEAHRVSAAPQLPEVVPSKSRFVFRRCQPDRSSAIARCHRALPSGGRRETDADNAGREALIRDLAEGQYRHRIDQFATCTGGRQWIHVDVERAKCESPFGAPIAHGYYTLTLVGALVTELETAD